MNDKFESEKITPKSQIPLSIYRYRWILIFPSRIFERLVVQSNSVLKSKC